MTKLDELMAKFCPNGVEYKELKDIAKISRGIRVVKKELAEKGKYPVYQNSMTPLGYYDKYNCPSNTTFIISAGAAGEIGYSYSEFWAADDCLYFICSDYLISRYLYHYLLTKQNILYSNVRKASVPRLSRNVVEKIKIP
ncbi:MAG: restriction endonuclease subunit S, partial [Selenomonadaceae bacterium]|nr:restriction endonuclease subunit S [Selenomonadaceae bacterium]